MNRPERMTGATGSRAQAAGARTRPLVLDVDGTFLKTDMLLESFLSGLGRAPLATLKAAIANLTRKARLKQELARLGPLRADLLPVNPDMAALARHGRVSGREVMLASGSDESLVAELARVHGIESWLASDGETNMTGPRKARALEARFGRGGFDYAGDGKVDRPVWEAAGTAILVGRHRALARELAATGQSVEQYPAGWRWRDLLRALRPHQWVKNVLLFLPMVAAHRFDLAGLLLVALGVVAFSAAASAIYIVNDLLDLEADRQHPTKRNRPFASGAVPIRVGMAAALGLGAAALGIAGMLGAAMVGVVAFYMALSLAYSLRLKRMRWIDIATLATLYTLRVVAGAVAADVEASGYLIAFIWPAFLTLGCVKRLTELTLATSDARLPGRGYGRADRQDLLNVAWIGIIGTLVVFYLYSLSDAAMRLYPTRWNLWLAMVPMAAWLVRMVVLGWRGRQDYDPIVFAMKDRIGIALLLLTLTLLLTATGH